MSAVYYWLHFLVMVFAVIGVVCWSIVSIRHNSVYLLVGSTLYLFNIIAFSSLRLFGLDIDPVTLNMWSLGIRLQGVITISGGGLFLLKSWHNHE
jgi:hypothetical protein